MLAPSPWSRWVAAGGAAVLAITVLDVAFGGETAVLTAVLVLVPLACAWMGSAGDAIVTAIAAIVAAALAGALMDSFENASFAVALAVVVLGSAVAAFVAVLRAGTETTLTRFRLLEEAGRVADGASALEPTIERLLDLVSPELADYCGLDALIDGRQQRMAARAVGPQAAEIEAALVARPPTAADAPAGETLALVSGRSHRVEIDDALLRAVAHDEQDLALLRMLQMRSGMFLALRARGRTLGALVLLTGPSGRRYTEGDLRFAQVLSGRVALALDNAGLTRELSTVEQQLSTIMEGLAAAVTVTDATSRIIYVNDAGVTLLRARSAQELYAADPAETMDRFAVYTEDGRPVSMKDLPGMRAVAGATGVRPMVVRNIVKATGEERWLRNRITPILDAQGHVVRVVNVIEDVTEVKRAERASRLLANASKTLAGPMDYERTLQRVAEMAVPTLADWCGVDVPGRRGLVESVAIAHADPAKLELGRELRQRYPVRVDHPEGLPAVIRDGHSEVIPEITDEMIRAYAVDEQHYRMLRDVGFASIMLVPLVAGGQTLGALTFVVSDPVRKFSEADLELAQELGRRAGGAILNARLFTERSALAETLQSGLLPPQLPRARGWATATLYRAAGEATPVGGDFYDLFATPAGWMALVGDVAGQGPEAATQTSLARFTLRTAGELTGDPALAVRHLNDALRGQGGVALCTAVCGVLRERTDGSVAMTLASAGHPLPLRLRAGEAESVGTAGVMAGAFPSETWPAATVEVRRDDVLVFYTDGVLDTSGPEGRFGLERLVATLRGAPADADTVVARLAEALDAFGRAPQRDDTAVLVLHYEGVGEATAGHAAREAER